MDMKVSSPSAGSKKRPPSRLQKRAPASLQLEQGAAGASAGAGPGPAAGPAAWRDGGAPIPLLSPLVMSPAVPVWEADQAGARRAADGPAVPAGGGGGGDQGGAGEEQPRGAARHGGSGERQSPSHDSPKTPVFAPAPTPASTPVQGAGAGWFHPALPTPVAEPASLVPLFKSQCAVEVRNAQQ
ncbi:hypothetical protein ACP70R_012603 [Stipagrostis hirtigluma subsp. patula]